MLVVHAAATFDSAIVWLVLLPCGFVLH